jgi:hypothetical protein
MGNDSDDSFFAVLTSYNENTILGGQAGRWLYGWNKINFAPVTNSGDPNQIYTPTDVMQLSHWSLDPNIKSSTSVDHTFAINLNEANNVTGIYAPGWNTPPAGFQYRPIGVAATWTPSSNTTIKHFVKMYKKSWKDVFNTATITLSDPSPTYENKYLYYFTAENILDGTCPP